MKVFGLTEFGIIFSLRCQLGSILSMINNNIAEHSPKNQNQASNTIAYVYFSSPLLLNVNPPTTSGPIERPIFKIAIHKPEADPRT